MYHFRVDHLYAFFVQWTPEIYGDQEDIDPEKRGFVVIPDNQEDDEDSLEVLDEYFGQNSCLYKDWEVCYDSGKCYPAERIIRIHCLCEGRIEKSVPRIAVWHHEACRVMTNCDPEGQIFLSYPHPNNGFFFLLFLFIYLFILK